MERMENDRIVKRVYEGECIDSYSVCRWQNKWIDTMKECLKEKCLDVRQARRIVHDRIV